MVPRLQVIGITGIPEIVAGDILSDIIVAAAQNQGTSLETGDILVVTQKIVSKAEGMVVDLRDVEPSPLALHLAQEQERDPRHLEVILRESRRIVRMDKGNIITETHHGFVCAASGVDSSNVPGEGCVCLLPKDPDASARQIREGILEQTYQAVAVIISDSFGRPWREGSVDVAIGVAGLSPVKDYRGTLDAYGYLLKVSVIAIADELASTAELVTGKSDGIPATIVRGYQYPASMEGIGALIRDPDKDLFR